jgi:hypothetical protein
LSNLVVVLRCWSDLVGDNLRRRIWHLQRRTILQRLDLVALRLDLAVSDGGGGDP